MNLDVDKSAYRRNSRRSPTFSDAPAPAVTRIVFSEADLQARAWLKNLCAEAGLDVREDAVGNTFARWAGTHPTCRRSAAAPTSTPFRTPGATTARWECSAHWKPYARCSARGIRPRRSIELILFTSEEPTRFGIGCLGSRLLSGTLDPVRADRSPRRRWRDLDEVRAAAGFSGPLASVALPAGYYHAFVELHIEQGPLLERAGIPLGIVTAIAAPATLNIRDRRRGRPCRRGAHARSPRRLPGRRRDRARGGSRR